MSWAPLFKSMFRGSLRGKRDALLVWAWVLANKDRNGVIEDHPSVIADETGIELTAVTQVIHSFCQPDPQSRSQLAEGRRLEPVPGLGYGWVVVTHELYRERARKQRYNEERTQSGQDAERKRVQREAAQKSKSPAKSGAVPPCPAIRSDHIKSDIREDSESESEGDARGNRARVARRATKRMPASYAITETLREWAIQHAPDVDMQRELDAIKDHEFKVAHKDWDAAFRNWLRRAQKDSRPRAHAMRQPAESKFQRMRRRADEVAE